MKEKRSIFQTVVFFVFIGFIIAGVLIFATMSAGGGGQQVGTVVIWGTFDEATVESYLGVLRNDDERLSGVSYEEKDPATYYDEITEALANGTGPDLFIIDQAHVTEHKNKIIPFPFDVVGERAFRDAFINEADMFIAGDGIDALPWSVDPLVLYWNRDLFAQTGYTRPPQYWGELFGMAERITERDKANTVTRATIAFGEYGNVTHAKDIIATLILQAGGAIVGTTADGALVADLTSVGQTSSGLPPTQSALRFYTEFADPVKSVYSWNRSLPNSIDAFAQERLALYVGTASDLTRIQARNGNLNFDVAPLPQIESGDRTRVVTFGTMYALAVPRTSQNVTGARTAAQVLTGTENSKLFAQYRGLPSPRRDVLATEPTDPVALIFRNAALIADAWYDPAPDATEAIFRRMVGDVTSGALRISDTIQRANQEMAQLLAP